MTTPLTPTSNRDAARARRAHRAERLLEERHRATRVFRVVSAAAVVALIVAIALPSIAPVERPRFHVGTTVVDGGDRVSEVELLSASEDGTELVARMWSGTEREYLLSARAGDPETLRVRHAGRLEPPTPVAMVFEGDGLILARPSGTVVQYRFSTDVVPCRANPAVVERTWTLCPVEDGPCIEGPSHPLGLCETGPLTLVELYEKGDVLWAVVERDLDHVRPRMIAGVAQSQGILRR